MKPHKTLTPQEIRSAWLRIGMTQNEWARKHGFNYATVSQVLTGKNTGSRGTGHKIAVMLGLKNGEIVEGTGDE